MDKASYETYETDRDYDSMEQQDTAVAERVRYVIYVSLYWYLKNRRLLLALGLILKKHLYKIVAWADIIHLYEPRKILFIIDPEQW